MAEEIRHVVEHYGLSPVRYLEYIESLDFSTVVPGHGELCGRKEITAIKSYLRDMERLALDQISEIRIPDAYLDWWFENFFVNNLRFMFRQVST